MLRGVYPESQGRTQHHIQVISCIALPAGKAIEHFFTKGGIRFGPVRLRIPGSTALRESLPQNPACNQDALHLRVIELHQLTAYRITLDDAERVRNCLSCSHAFRPGLGAHLKCRSPVTPIFSRGTFLNSG